MIAKAGRLAGTEIERVEESTEAAAGGIGVLAVQGDFHAHGQALERIGAGFRLVRKVSELCGLKGLIIPGGESTTLLKFLQEEGLFEAIREFAQAHPIFGTCAGAILLADRVEHPAQESLGLMRMTVRRNGYGRQLASSIHSLDPSTDLEDGPEAGTPLEVVLIRAPIIVEVGGEVEVLARLEDEPVLVRQGRLLAGTFHPELSADGRVHRYFCRRLCGIELKRG